MAVPPYYYILVLIFVLLKAEHDCESNSTAEDCIKTNCVWLNSSINSRCTGKKSLIKVTLKKDGTHTIDLSYLRSNETQLDVYYLMDYSKTMSHHIKYLASHGDDVRILKNYTSVFQIGLGGFVDKNKMVSLEQLSLSSISTKNNTQEEIFEYRNMLNLTQDTDEFLRRINNATITKHKEIPRGALDGILQTTVCPEIGWTDDAEKFLIVVTDARFASAGDGDISGITKRNDGKCHLKSNGYYDETYKQDYPSEEQINSALKEKSINIVFAVTKQVMKIYKNLTKSIEGASVVELKNDSSNIIELTKNQHEQILSSVKIRHNATSEINLQFSTSCSGATNGSDKCDNVQLVGDVVNFKITIKVLQCEKLKSQIIHIYHPGINYDVFVHSEIQCDDGPKQPGNKTSSNTEDGEEKDKASRENETKSSPWISVMVTVIPIIIIIAIIITIWYFRCKKTSTATQNQQSGDESIPLR
ncbi:integrin beta-PS-like [Rhynchophorus ferrugineus]|uniref:integrin beta-PS-like n=1 Tax=Rhynchophorus ferrugineus TaxID=354439 RepID=UPI003FCCB10D